MVSSATSTRCRRVAVTRAAGIPAAVTAVSSSRAPGRQLSPSPKSSKTRCSSHCTLSASLRQGWPMSVCRIVIERLMLVPTMAARAGADSVPP
jgi:hypothetical protein